MIPEPRYHDPPDRRKIPRFGKRMFSLALGVWLIITPCFAEATHLAPPRDTLPAAAEVPLPAWQLLQPASWSIGLSGEKQLSAYLQRCATILEGKDLETRCQILSAAINEKPNDPILRYHYGMLFWEKARFLSCKEQLDLVMRIEGEPQDPEPSHPLVIALIRKIRKSQKAFDVEGAAKLQLALICGKKSPVRWAVTVYQAFRFSPSLAETHPQLLEEAIRIYLDGLEKEKAKGSNLLQPMLQLAYLYHLSGKKDCEAQVCMDALDHVTDSMSEGEVTLRFNFLNRPNFEKVVDCLLFEEFDECEIPARKVSDIFWINFWRSRERVQLCRQRLEQATTGKERRSIIQESFPEMFAGISFLICRGGEVFPFAVHGLEAMLFNLFFPL